MTDVEEPAGDKEANKPPSPKPDQDGEEVAPPLVNLDKDKPGIYLVLNFFWIYME